MSAPYSVLADLTLLVHLAFIAFVVGGQACIVAGGLRGWRWVRRFAFRLAHLLAIGVVVAQAWANRVCPLTVWESDLRVAAGGEAYSGTFIQHWVGRLVFYDAPQWVFTLVYTLFGALVLASWVWVRPGRQAHGKDEGTTTR